MEIHFKIIGVLLIVLALVHIVFPKYFNWDEELKSLSLINRQMVAVHTFFIALVVFLMGLLCLSSANELITTKLGKKNIIRAWVVLDNQAFFPVFWLLIKALERQNI